MEWPKVTLFGDSITRRSLDPDFGCWGAMVGFQLGSYFDVDARGFEGYNTKLALDVMPKLFPKSYLDKVEIFNIFFGHNDAWCHPPLNVPVEDYERNLHAMLKYLLDNGLEKQKIILVTPSWFYEEDFFKYLDEIGMPRVTKTFESAKSYSDTVKKVGKTEGVEVVDVFGPTSTYEPLKSLFCDGVHFSREGARLVFNQLMPVIERKIVDKYQKPLADLWHSHPIELHPEIKPYLDEYKRDLLAKAAKRSGSDK